jgi:uncharacterized cysteine cluster protein YcgN (CxxCxxCC family)
MSELRPNFWTDIPMNDLTRPEWEALCDGCGKCCLNKLEDEDGTVALTRVACKLLDGNTCQCTRYPIRHQYVPECIVMTPKSLEDNMYWLPQTCAYRLVFEGRDLYNWHPLISGEAASVYAAGVSMKGRSISEDTVSEDDWDNHIIEEPT